MTQLTIPIDDTLKEQADTLFEELGMNTSTAINVFIREALRQGGIPFRVSIEQDPFYHPDNINWLEESMEQGRQGRYIVKTIDELERMTGQTP
jgi:DNA-damage-inducible protein J